MVLVNFVLLCFILSIILFKPYKSKIPHIFILSLYHFGFAYIFLQFSKDQVNDSLNYYNWSYSRNLEDLSFMGTDFIIRIVKFVRYIGIEDYNIIFYLFSMISGLAIIGLFNFINKNFNSIKVSRLKLEYVFLLLPGLHFWTVAIGKDALTLLAIYLICVSIFFRKTGLFLGAIILLILVRYHIAILFLIGFLLHLLFSSKTRIFNLSTGIIRTIVLVISIPAAALVYSFALSSIQKYSSSGFEGFGDFIDNRTDAYSESGSGAILTGQPYFIKVLAMILGGIPWLSLDPLSIAAMFEGFIILILLFYALSKMRTYKKFYNTYSEPSAFLLWFVILFLLFMPLISGNLGLIVRMRVMLYFPIFCILYFTNLQKINKDN